MKITSHLIILCIAAFFFAGCSSTQMLGTGDASLAELTAVLDAAEPSSYESTRQNVVQTLSALEQQQAALVGSPAARAKKIITTAGVILGLGGTITSFIIKDEDTKASIAQASSAVGGVTGIVSLIPFGSGAEKAKSVQGYLAGELDAFQQRWPETGELTDEQWSAFIGDSKRMIDTVDLLQQ